MSDQNEAEEISIEAVRDQLQAMKPETFEQVAAAVNAQAQKRRDDSDQANLGNMSPGEYRNFVRRKYGYDPQI